VLPSHPEYSVVLDFLFPVGDVGVELREESGVIFWDTDCVKEACGLIFRGPDVGDFPSQRLSDKLSNLSCY
jgi:hypothetical protein